jgi:hypothetical protein
MRQLLAVCALVAFAACGGDGNGPPTALPITPTVSITATGNGLLVIHPSLDAVWCCKLYTPITVQETAGGTASWNFARFSVWLNGVEIERGEIGADILAQPPDWTSIEARQDEDYALVFGINSTDFDDLTLTLGFSDRKDGRQFMEDIPFTSFDGVDLSVIPLARETGVHRLD